MVPAMPQCMVLNDELSRYRSAKTQRERRRVIEFLIREGPHRHGRISAVPPQKFERGRLRNLSILLSMFSIQLCDDLPT